MAHTNVLVGNRFHVLSLADVLTRLGEDFTLYSSLPRSRFQSRERQYETRFVPLIGSILRKLTRINTRRWTEHEVALFDRLALLRLKPADVLYGWAGYSALCGEQMKLEGGSYFLERSCPHLEFQEELLEDEAARLEIAFKKKPKFWIERCLKEYELADRIVVPSSYSRDSFLERGFSKEKVVLAPLDRPSLSPQKVPFPEQFVVGVVGGNILRKGFQYLFEAWEKLSLSDSRLLVKASEAELRSSPVLARFLDQHSNIEVVGHFEKMEDFYNQCSVCVLPSVDDGFGLAPLEAVSCGRPVIITENVGAKDILRGSGAASIVEAKSVEALRVALGELHASQDLRECMSQAAFDFAGELDSRSKYESSIEELYSSVTQKRTDPKLKLSDEQPLSV